MKKSILLSAIASTCAALSAQAEDNYLIGETWGGGSASAQANWSLSHSPATTDDVIFDYVYYQNAVAGVSSTSWNVSLWVNPTTESLKAYAQPNSITIQNLYNKDTNTGISMSFLPASDATGTPGLKIAQDLTFKTDSYNSTFSWSSIEAKKTTAEIGGNLNIGTADSLDTDVGTFRFGTTLTTQSVQKVTIGGDINIYGGAKFVTTTGTPDAALNVGSPTMKVTGAVNMQSIGSATPTWIINNASSGTIVNSVIDIESLKGSGTITTSTGSLASETYLILRNKAGTISEFKGTISGSKITLLYAKQSTDTVAGTQILSGEVSVRTVESRYGTLLLNGKNIGLINVWTGSAIGAIGENSKYGTINVETLNFGSTGKILFDIGGDGQDFINVTTILKASGIVDLDFNVAANTEIGKDYKLISYTDTALSVDSFNAIFAEGVEGTLSMKDNALWVTFTQVVPEPAEWAAIFGAAALALAFCRKRK